MKLSRFGDFFPNSCSPCVSEHVTLKIPPPSRKQASGEENYWKRFKSSLGRWHFHWLWTCSRPVLLSLHHSIECWLCAVAFLLPIVQYARLLLANEVTTEVPVHSYASRPGSHTSGEVIHPWAHLGRCSEEWEHVAGCWSSCHNNGDFHYCLMSLPLRCHTVQECRGGCNIFFLIGWRLKLWTQVCLWSPCRPALWCWCCMCLSVIVM